MRFRVTRAWYVQADTALEAIEASAGQLHDEVAATPAPITRVDDPTVVRMTVETRRPEDYVLVDRGTSQRWVIRDGRWVSQ